MLRLLLTKSPITDWNRLCHGIFLQRSYQCMCQMGAVQVGFQSDGMIRVPAVFQPFHEDSQQIWTFSAKYLSFSLLCALLRQLLCICIITDETGCAMVILLPWCDFPLPDVTFSVSLLWHGDDLAFFRLMWLKHGACNSQGPLFSDTPTLRLDAPSETQKNISKYAIDSCFSLLFSIFLVLCLLLFLLLCFLCSFCFCVFGFLCVICFFNSLLPLFVLLLGYFLFVRVFGFFAFLRVFLLFVVTFFLFCLLPCSSALSQVLLQQQQQQQPQPKRKLQNNENNKSDKRSKSSEKMP